MFYTPLSLCLITTIFLSFSLLSLYISELRGCICEQLIASPRTWSGTALTGPRINKLAYYIVQALNSGKQVLPSSAYKSMVKTTHIIVHLLTTPSPFSFYYSICVICVIIYLSYLIYTLFSLSLRSSLK